MYRQYFGKPPDLDLYWDCARRNDWSSQHPNRLSSTWQHIQALELIDPLGPDLDTHATPAVWEALKDICRRRGLNFHECQRQIIRLRSEARDLDQDSRAMIRMDLCGYLRDRHMMFAMTVTESPTPDYDALCEVVFSIPLTSSFVESLFSKMLYHQIKIRSYFLIPSCW